MILATIAIGSAQAPQAPRQWTRGLEYDPPTLDLLARLASLVTGGARTIAQIDDDGRWTSANPELAGLLDRFFGPSFDPLAFYSPDGRGVEVARDAAHHLGGEVVGALIEEEGDESAEEGVVF